MIRKHGRSAAALEARFHGAVLGAGAGPTALSEAVAGALTEALGDWTAALPPEALAAAAAAAARGAARTRRDLGGVARGYMLGALRASRRTGEPALDAIANAGRAFFARAGGSRADAPGAARGLVEGAIAWAREYQEDAGEAATAAGQAVVDAAHEAGPATGRKTREALKHGVAGFDLELRDPARLRRDFPGIW